MSTQLQDGRVFFVPSWASAHAQAYVYDPDLDRIEPAGEAIASGYSGCTLLHDGRVLLVPCSATSTVSYGDGKTVVFDPAAESCSVTTPASHPGGYHAGGALLADGRMLMMSGQNGDLADCRIWDAETDTYAPAAELAALPALGQGAYQGGCVLPDGRVVFTPWFSRHLVVWDPGLGTAYGRDVALAAFWNRRP